MKRAGVLGGAVVFALGAGCGGQQALPTPLQTTGAARAAPPPLVTIDVLGVTIAPSKADGREWDGLPGQPSRTFGAAASLGIVAGGYDAAIALLGELVNAGCNPPDVEGEGSLFVSGVESGERWFLPEIQDTFAPTWHPSAHWVHVVLDDRVRIRLSLTDEDISDDDPIGDVELNVNHLRTALAKQRIYQVPVADQNPQVLFVALSVTRE